MPATSTIILSVNTREGLTRPDKRGSCWQASHKPFVGFFIFGLLIGSGGQTVEKSKRAIQSHREGHGVFARKGLFHLLDCHLIDVVADLTGAFMLPACYQGAQPMTGKKKNYYGLKKKRPYISNYN